MPDYNQPQPLSTTQESPSLTESPNAEEVATFIVELAKIRALVAEAQATLAEITSAAAQVEAAKTKVVDDQAVIATKSDRIEGAQKHADKVRRELDRLRTAATEQTTEAEGQKTRAQAAADNTTQLLTDVQTIKGIVEGHAEAVAAVRRATEESAGSTKRIADQAATMETRISEYQTQIEELKIRCADQLKAIESLLPGATSAGLAHSFDTRRQTFLKLHNVWQIVFISSILALGATALTGLMHAYGRNSVPTLAELGQLWLAGLPIVGALIWLAIHASREAAQAKRIEEDYGFKAATSTWFEGFRRQLSEVGRDIPADSPFARLCADMLKTIANPPGRLHDKPKLTSIPASELVEAADTFLEAVKSKDSNG
jgi:hypothetical protein